MRRAYAPIPWWAFHALNDDMKTLWELGFDPNARSEDWGLPLEYVIRTKQIQGVVWLLRMGARVTPELLDYGKRLCHHTEAQRLDYEGDCCLILEMLQHAHDLLPRLRATVWTFAQMSGTWRDLIQLVVEERMSKEESD